MSPGPAFGQQPPPQEVIEKGQQAWEALQRNDTSVLGLAGFETLGHPATSALANDKLDRVETARRDFHELRCGFEHIGGDHCDLVQLHLGITLQTKHIYVL